jgi:hypothetical protein
MGRIVICFNKSYIYDRSSHEFDTILEDLNKSQTIVLLLQLVTGYTVNQTVHLF